MVHKSYPLVFQHWCNKSIVMISGTKKKVELFINLAALFINVMRNYKSLSVHPSIHWLKLFPEFLVACTRLYNPLCPSVTLCFFGVYWRFWGHCSCPTAWLVYFITASAHPHAIRVAVYPALLNNKEVEILCKLMVIFSMQWIMFIILITIMIFFSFFYRYKSSSCSIGKPAWKET